MAIVTVIWKLESIGIANAGRYVVREDLVPLPEGAVPVKLDVDEEVSTLYYMVPE